MKARYSVNGFLAPTSDKKEDTSVLHTEQETEQLSFVSGFGLWSCWHLSLPGEEGLGMGGRGCPPRASLRTAPRVKKHLAAAHNKSKCKRKNILRI